MREGLENQVVETGTNWDQALYKYSSFLKLTPRDKYRKWTSGSKFKLGDTSRLQHNPEDKMPLAWQAVGVGHL